MTCELGGNKFAVSVADILLFDTSCGGEQLILNGKTLLNSSITQAVQQTTVYGGKGSQTLYEFNYQKEITVTIEDAVFSPVYMAVQNGTNLVNEEDNFYTSEKVTFDATGTATLKGTPVGNVQIPDAAGTYATVQAVGQTLVAPEFAGMEKTVVFAEAGEFRKLKISASSFPKAMKLVMKIDIFDSNGKVEEMQIVIPQFKPDGNIDLSLTNDGVATSAMAGKAFANCDGDYAIITWKVIDQTTVPCYSAFIANHSTVEVEIAGTEQLAIKGVRGGLYGNISIPAEQLTFTSGDELIATVDATGLITGVSAGNTMVTISDGKGTTLLVAVEVTV
jgi:hypothetical protein